MNTNTSNQEPTANESDVTLFKKELLDLLIDKIDGTCSKCGRFADEPKPTEKCEYSDVHESFYWVGHPVNYAIQKYGIESTIFDAERVNSHIAEHPKDAVSSIVCALVFDGNGLFDYLNYASPLHELANAIDELVKKYGFHSEPYHHWNLVFYRMVG